MINKEKVINGWECHMESDTLRCADCPYRDGWRTCNYADTLYKDVYDLLKEQEAKKVIESTNIVRCDDCEYSFCEGFVRERLYCEKHPELGEIKGDWFCADCWKA